MVLFLIFGFDWPVKPVGETGPSPAVGEFERIFDIFQEQGEEKEKKNNNNDDEDGDEDGESSGREILRDVLAEGSSGLDAKERREGDGYKSDEVIPERKFVLKLGIQDQAVGCCPALTQM